MSRPTDSFAPHACVSCRKQKRKCTKEIPKCTLCQRLRKPCDYAANGSPSKQEELIDLQQRVNELETRLGHTNHAGINGVLDTGFNFNTSLLSTGSDRVTSAQRFPAVFFLEPEITRLTRPTVPKPVMMVPQEVLSALGGRSQYSDITSKFFSTIHLWLPFVAKKRIELALSNSTFELKADAAALFLAMALVIGRVEENSPDSQLYQLTKNYFALLESRGCISIPLVQTSILIAIYEIGHAIYPAAYLSTARAARLGQVFGIDNRSNAPQMGPEKYGSWAEDQEVKRIWWTIMILDRFVNLGISGHALVTGEPRHNQMLPADCRQWDDGQITNSEPLYLFSPVSIQASPFARTCQAANLMGRYIRHRDDSDDDSQPSHRYEDALQLHRTITAFSKLLPNGYLFNPVECSTPAALTYSTLLHFYDPYSCSEANRNPPTEESIKMQEIAVSGLKKTALDVLALSKVLRPEIIYDSADMSPFLVECLFQGAATLAWIVHEEGPGQLHESYNHFKAQLRFLSKRWTLAGVYLDILNQARSVLYNDNALL